MKICKYSYINIRERERQREIQVRVSGTSVVPPGECRHATGEGNVDN